MHCRIDTTGKSHIELIDYSRNCNIDIEISTYAFDRDEISYYKKLNIGIFKIYIIIRVLSLTGRAFTLTEEKSSWDSSAVLANFVLPNWGNDYVTVKGQGLTIYVFGSNATWVNGGILYKIIDETNTLTKQQLHDIAVGL